MFKVHWTEDILAEVLYRTRRKNPTISGAQIATIRDRIADTLSDGRVTDYVIDGTFPGDDEDDQHVHAAAVACRASILLTADAVFLARHPESDHLPYDVYGPDGYLCLVLDSDRALVRAVTVTQAAYWCRRMKGNECDGVDLPERLRAAGCPEFAEHVRLLLQEIDVSEFWTPPEPP